MSARQKQNQKIQMIKTQRFYLDASFQVAKRLFAFAFNNIDNDAKKQLQEQLRNNYRKYFFQDQMQLITLYKMMAEIFMIDRLMIKSKNDKEMIIQQDVCQITSTSKIIISYFQMILGNKENQILI